MEALKDGADSPKYSLMLTLRSGSKLTFIEVLIVNNYKITFLSNIQILSFTNISNCEEFL